MTVETMMNLIPNCIPVRATQCPTILHMESEEDQHLYEWLNILWDYLRKEAPDLSSFEDLPILPIIASNGDLSVINLCKKTSVICTLGGESKDIEDVLHVLGITLAKDLPEYVFNHAGVMGTYVLPCNPNHVVSALVNANMPFVKHLAVSKDSLNRFRCFLAKVNPSSIDACHLNILRSLEIFESVQGNIVCVRDVSVAAPDDRPNIKLDTPVLNMDDQPSKILAEILNIEIKSITEYLIQFVLPSISECSTNLGTVFTFVRDRWIHIKGKESQLLEELSNIPFVPVKVGKYVKPCQIFDPKSELLSEMFLGDGVFPKGEYTSDMSLTFLKDIGMKTESKIGASDILNCVHSIVHMCDDQPETATRKALALCRMLDRCPALLSLTDDMDTDLREHLRNLCWLPVVVKRPSMYPDSLPWYNGPMFEKPTSVKSDNWSLLVGSSSPVFHSGEFGMLASEFDWLVVPSAQQLVRHFRNVIDAYKYAEKTEYPEYMKCVNEMYQQFQTIPHTVIIDALDKECLDRWVWTGDGFSQPEHVVNDNPFLDTFPYLYSLPKEVKQHKDMLIRFGIIETCDMRALIRVLEQIQEAHQQSQSQSNTNKRDLQMAVDIINILVDHVKELQNENIPISRIPIPVHSGNGDVLKLVPLEMCTYVDTKWLQTGLGGGLGADDEDEDLNYIHKNVPTKAAETLKVPSLMSRLLDANEFDIEGCGQHEELTTRLKNLLKDYADGYAILKELIQNADDGKATVVKFMYDERTNEDCMTYLIDEGMKACHGPALWAYNDAEFTDEDFSNITKLGAATKESMRGKIGKFGLGFNAVYNLTDVPSFISREYVVIFDPHRTHLGKAIRQGVNPGIKINITKNKKMMSKVYHQFEPFNGVFDCNIKSQKPYNGTLFRFPLRTYGQADKSEISDQPYGHKQMLRLIQKLIDGSASLLLFTQHVTKVELYHLRKNETDPSKATKVFVLNRDISLCSGDTIASDMSILEAASEKVLDKLRKPHDFQLTNHVQVTTQVSNYANESLELESSVTSREWMVTWTLGDMKLAEKMMQKGLIPLAATAVPLQRCHSNSAPSVLQDGSIYCFLPLPIQTGLPVHINGSFALESSRKMLGSKTGDETINREAEWNECLLADAVVESYIVLLNNIAHTSTEDFEYHSLWPTFHGIQVMVKPLLTAFYDRLCDCDDVVVRQRAGRSIYFKDMVYLDPAVKNNNSIGRQISKVMDDICKNTVNIPQKLMDSFHEVGKGEFIQGKMYDEERFYREVFFPNIGRIDKMTRDELVLHALEKDQTSLNVLLKQQACIPITPDGAGLKTPCSLIDPNCMAAYLYTKCDAVFPYGPKFNSCKVLALLQQLDMQTEISWDDMLERARHILKIHMSDIMERSENIAKIPQCRLYQTFIEHLRSKLTWENKDSSTYKVFQSEIQEVHFLYPKVKPAKFPKSLQWKSEDVTNCQLITPKEAFLSEAYYLTSASQFIVDDTKMPAEVKTFLGLSNKQIQVADVIYQLEQAMDVDVSSLKKEAFDSLRNMCKEVYMFLDNVVSKDGDNSQATNPGADKHDTDISSLEANLQVTVSIETKCKSNVEGVDEESNHFEKIKTALRGKPFVFVWNKFHYVQNVALLLGTRKLEMYLCELPRELIPCKGLFVRLGMKPYFSTKDYMRVLHIIEEDHKQNILSPDVLEITLELVKLLSISINGVKVSQIEDQYGTIYLPDVDRQLRPTKELCYRPKNFDWIKCGQNEAFTHTSVSTAQASNLGVMTQRSYLLHKHLKGFGLGQKEFTTRLKNIVSIYPFNHRMLMELIKTADNSGATEIQFILDKRHHLGEQIFEDCWKPMQGPALCVYYNKPFTKDDLSTIQRLSMEGRYDDPERIKQYGIGFNAMYHLTDAPVLLTAGSEIGETLYVFDPTCSYVPDTDASSPGIMIEDLNDLKETFTDVFKCFLGEHLKLSDATLYRFALRGKEMAKKSPISEKCITIQNIEDILDTFQYEVKEILLFTHHISKIIIKVIEIDGTLHEKYMCVSELDDTDRQKADSSTALSTKVCTSVKESKDESKVQASITTQALTITDTADPGTMHHWIVSKQIGLTGSVTQSFDNEELMLSPQGGIALQMDTSCQYKVCPTYVDGKLFCFLHMAIETRLPFHIHGNFILRLENNHWTTNEGPQYMKDWNKCLYTEIIVPCYVTALEKFRETMSLKLTQCYSERELKTISEKYMKVLPTVTPITKDWHTMIQSIYRKLGKQQFLPSMYQQQESVHEMYRFRWISPSDQQEKGYLFNTKRLINCYSEDNIDTFPRCSTSSMVIKDILLHCGMNMYLITMKDRDNLEKVSVCIDLVSEKVFKLNRHNQVLCQLHLDLPAPISKTPFKSIEALSTFLCYCKENYEGILDIEGTPLLATNESDPILRIFDANNPVYRTTYNQLVTRCSSKFLNTMLHTNVFYDISQYGNFFMPFGIKAFAKLLPFVVPKRTLNMIWNQQKPPEEWLKQVWKFILEQINDALPTRKIITRYTQRCCGKRSWSEPIIEIRTIHAHYCVYASKVRKILKPLQAFSIIPGIKNEMLHLFSLADATHWLSLRDQKEDKYCRVLAKLNLPVLPNNSEYLSSNGLDLLDVCIATLRDHASVWLWLSNACNSEQGICYVKAQIKKLHQSEKEGILSLFKTLNFDKIEERDILRALPLFTTISNAVVALDEKTVYTLDESIPTDDIDTWTQSDTFIFLKHCKDLGHLYKALSCSKLPTDEVYVNFIIPQFGIGNICKSAIFKHLRYLYNNYFKQSEMTNTVLYLQKKLSSEPFVEATDGCTYRANELFDPTLPILREMRKDWLAKHMHGYLFTKEEFLHFLRILGMKCDVTTADLEMYCREVALTGKTGGSENSHRQSETLVQEMFKIKDEKERMKAFDIVLDIPFLVPYRVSENLAKLSPQYGITHVGEVGKQYVSFGESYSSKYEHFIWTDASMYHEHWIPRDNKHEKLNRQPPVEKVLFHIQTLCDSSVPQLDVEYIELRGMVLVDILQYLQNSGMNEKQMKQMKGIPCIHVENGAKLVYPWQTVMEICAEDVVPSLLYKLPSYIPTELHTFLTQIGTTQQATLGQYSQVLCTIANQTNSPYAKMNHQAVQHPKQVVLAAKAMKGFFHLLVHIHAKKVLQNQLRDEQIKQEVKIALKDTKVLYLLTKYNTLSSSFDVIFNDAPSFYDRTGNVYINYLVNLRECGIVCEHPDDLLELLPGSLKPKRLSGIITERRIDNSYTMANLNSNQCIYSQVKGSATEDNTTEDFCREDNDLEDNHTEGTDIARRLTSENFGKSVERIIHHEAYQREKRLSREYVQSLVERLTTIKVCTVGKLESHLEMNGKVLKGSSREKMCFPEIEHMGSRITKRTLYIQEIRPDDKASWETLLLLLADIVNTMLDRILHGSVLQLLPILRCTVGSMDKELDRLNVRQMYTENSNAVVSQTHNIPFPGGIVADVYIKHMQVVTSASDLQAGEYVAYQDQQDVHPVYGIVKQTGQFFLIDLDLGSQAVKRVPMQKLMKFNVQ